MKKADHTGLRTWIEIDTKALEYNYQAFRRRLPEAVQMMAIVKSNAYGHYLHEYARQMERLGVEWLGVDSLTEGIALREIGIRLPILVLGYTLPERFAEAADLGISLTISSFESLRLLTKWKHESPIYFHLKIDTGMHRQGFLEGDLKKVMGILKKLPEAVVFEGVYTHFAGKDPYDSKEADSQISLFEKWLTALRNAEFAPIAHASNSWGTIGRPDARYDMVRSGIGLMGHYPSVATKEVFGKHLLLKPILTWKTIVSEIKTLPEGGGVGYDLTEIVPAGARLGICPIGYWHGFPRTLSSKGYVIVRGKKAKVIGRVSMDILIVDLSRIPNAKVGDEVVVIGKQGGEEITAEQVAELAGTSNYEILTRINPLIKRIYR